MGVLLALFLLRISPWWVLLIASVALAEAAVWEAYARLRARD